MSAPYTGRGMRFLARRCASATVSNHAFAIGPLLGLTVLAQ
jgi:hypothetical protein